MDQDEVTKVIKEITEKNQQLMNKKAANGAENVYTSIFSTQSDESDSNSKTSVDETSQESKCSTSFGDIDNVSPPHTFNSAFSQRVSRQSTENKVSDVSEDELYVEECSEQLENPQSRSPRNSSEKRVQFYAGPYGLVKSPFKKSSSFQSFAKGVKRSPR